MGFSRFLTLRAALVLSLVVNAFLLAILAAPHLAPPPPRERGEARIADRIARRLPEPDRPAFREAHARHEVALGRSFDALRQSRQQVRATLEAEPFDPAAFGRAAGEAQRASDAVQVAIYAMIAEAAPSMSPRGRQLLVPGSRRD